MILYFRCADRLGNYSSAFDLAKIPFSLPWGLFTPVILCFANDILEYSMSLTDGSIDNKKQQIISTLGSWIEVLPYY